MTHQLTSINENIYYNETITKKQLFYEHDYCGANFTWNIENRAFSKNFMRNIVDKWTNRLSVQIHTDDNLNKFIAKQLAIHRVKYSFLPEKQIRGKVLTKFGIPTIMGGILSRPLSIFSGSSTNEFFPRRRKNSNKMPHTKNVAKLEAVSQLTSEEMRKIVELKNLRRSDIRKKSIDRSQFITNESEIFPKFLSEFEFPEDTQISSTFTRKLTPFHPLSNTSSIYSQLTQAAAENSQLPDFHQTFSSLTPTHFSNCYESLPLLTQNYPSLNSQQITACEMYKEDSRNHQQYLTSSAKSLVLTNNEIMKNTGFSKSPSSSLILPETQENIDLDDLSTQSLSFPFPNRNERSVSHKAQTPTKPRGLKRQEPESLWTDIEETCESGSPIIELINNGVSQLSNAGAKDMGTSRNLLKYRECEPESLLTNFEETCEMELPIIGTTINDIGHWATDVVNPCNVSIGTSLSAPAFLTTRNESVDTVDHDHCYDDKRNKSVLHKRTFDVSKPNNGRHATNVHRNKFSKNRFEQTTVEDGIVKKDNKRKSDYNMNKENAAATKPSHYNISLLAQTRRLSLNDLNENEAKSPEFPTPARKRVRLLSPDNEHKSLKNRKSAVSRRTLTPFYCEHKSTKYPGLTPFYTSLEDTDRCDSTKICIKQRNIRQQRLTPYYADRESREPVVIDISSDDENENNAKEPVKKLISFYPEDKKYEPEIIDISADTDDTKSITKLVIDNFGTKASQLSTKVKISSQTALSNVEATLETTLPLSKNILLGTNDDGYSSPLNSQCSIARPLPTDDLFSNFCCEYDHSRRNVPLSEISPYESKLLKHLVEPTDKEIRENIDEALKFLETLDDDL